MVLKENEENWNQFYGKEFTPIPFKQTQEYTFWKITLFRNTFQVIILALTFILPWYRFYRPPTATREATIIEAGAFNLGGQMLGVLLISMIVSLIAVIWLFRRRNQKTSSTILLFDFSNIALALIILGFLGQPVFLPGLGGLYSDYIGLFTLNWAGFTVYPMLGYFFVLASIGSIVIGVLLYFFYS
ncbi:MAG: hypothetical protein ACXAC8_05580 [Candidatus Hodarchaeales archaeon]|jgi:hypothetical protein